MTTTISYSGGVTVTPDLALHASADVEIGSRTVTHEILDGAPVHTLRPARPKTGTIHLLFTSSARAHAAADALVAPDVYTVTSDDDVSLNLRIIIRSVRVEQAADARRNWAVHVGYEAVT